MDTEALNDSVYEHRVWLFFSGVYNYQVEEDINKLKLCVNSLLQEYSLNVNVKDDYIHELYV